MAFKYKVGDKLGPYHMELIKRTKQNSDRKWKALFKCNYDKCVYWDYCNREYEAEISLVVSGKRFKCKKGNRKTPLTDIEKGINKYQDEMRPTTGKFKYHKGDRISPYNIKLINREYKKNNRWYGLFECPYCHKSFISSIHDVQDGSSQSCGCLKNSSKTWANGQVKWQSGDYIGPHKIYMIQRLQDRDKYQKPLGLFQCPYSQINQNCLKTFITPIERVKSGITSSCGCKIISHGEEKILKILKNANIKYETQYTFKDCINVKTSRKLRFDFYLPDYNCCIEYDGQQHFLDYVKKK